METCHSEYNTYIIFTSFYLLSHLFCFPVYSLEKLFYNKCRTLFQTSLQAFQFAESRAHSKLEFNISCLNLMFSVKLCIAEPVLTPIVWNLPLCNIRLQEKNHFSPSNLKLCYFIFMCKIYRSTTLT